MHYTSYATCSIGNYFELLHRHYSIPMSLSRFRINLKIYKLSYFFFNFNQKFTALSKILPYVNSYGTNILSFVYHDKLNFISGTLLVILMSKA